MKSTLYLLRGHCILKCEGENALRRLHHHCYENIIQMLETCTKRQYTESECFLKSFPDIGLWTYWGATPKIPTELFGLASNSFKNFIEKEAFPEFTICKQCSRKFKRWYRNYFLQNLVHINVLTFYMKLWYSSIYQEKQVGRDSEHHI